MEILRQHPDYQQVMSVCNVLHAKGFTSWLAGGCVRDGLLGRLPKDFDVVTNALPEQIEHIFNKTVAVGKQFGIIVVIEKSCQIEVATFRSDGEYVDGRRPTTITFSGPKEDAARRDFTINAMFLDPQKNEIHDYVGGKSDLQKKIIRTVGEPKKRFEEDRLRILRGVRFVADLGFQIDTETFIEIKKQAPDVLLVSRERQKDELVKLLAGSYLKLGLDIFQATGFFQILLKISKSDSQKVLEFFQKILIQDITEAGRYALFFGVDSEFKLEPAYLKNAITRVEKMMTEFKFSNLEQGLSVSILKALKSLQESPRMATILKLSTQPWNQDLYKLIEALRVINYELADSFKLFCEKVKAGYKLPARYITSEDLSRLGVSSGPNFGHWLETAYDMQIEGQLNSQNEAREWLKKELLKQV